MRRRELISFIICSIAKGDLPGEAAASEADGLHRYLHFSELKGLERRQRVLKLRFGSGPTDQDEVSVRDVMTLGHFFEPFQKRTNRTVINSELQRYVPFGSRGNFVFEDGGLVLKAVIDERTVPGVIGRVRVTENVVQSRIVPVSSIAGAVVGTIVGFGPHAAENLHRTRTYGVMQKSAVKPGHEFGLKFGPITTDPPIRLPFSTIRLRTEAGDQAATIASKLVEAINNDLVLAGLQISAQVVGDSEAFIISSPALKRGPGSIGRYSIGSIDYLDVQAYSYVGGLEILPRSPLNFTFVVRVAPGALTLSHPVSLPNGSIITLNPSRCLFPDSSSRGRPNELTLHGEVSLLPGTPVWASYFIKGLNFVKSAELGSIQLEQPVGLPHGQPIVTLPFILCRCKDSINGSLDLKVEPSVPDIPVGSVFWAGDEQSSSAPIIRVTAFDPGRALVRLDRRVTIRSGQLLQFRPLITSGQIWSRWLGCPGWILGQDEFGIELTVEFPKATSFGAWPAIWLRRNPDDRDSHAVPHGSIDEIDLTDTFNYWSNGSFNNFKPSWTGRDQYVHPQATDVDYGLAGNNLGRVTRRVALRWSERRISVYLDDQLIREGSAVYNSSQRAQLGINLAVGSGDAHSMPEGFFPLDVSCFPIRFKIEKLEIFCV